MDIGMFGCCKLAAGGINTMKIVSIVFAAS